MPTGIQTWNPNSSTVLGLEWFPTVADRVVLDHEDEVLVTQIKATVTETVASVQFRALDVEEDSTWIQIDVYEDNLPQNVTPSTTNWRPYDVTTRISYGMASGRPSGNPPSPGYTQIADDDPATNHYNPTALHPGVKFYESWSSQGVYANWPNRRVLWTRIWGQVDNIWQNGFSQPVTFEPMLIGGMNSARHAAVVGNPPNWAGTAVWTGWTSTTLDPRRPTDNPQGARDPIDGTPIPYGTLDSGLILAEPRSNRPWRPDLLFDYVGNPGYNPATPGRGWNTFGVRMGSAYAAEDSIHVIELGFEAGWLPNEDRIGHGTQHLVAPGWHKVPIITASDWTKIGFQMTAGKTYFFVLRLIRDMSKTRKVGSLTLGRLAERGTKIPVRGGFQSSREVLDNPHGLLTKVTSQSTRIIGLVPTKPDNSPTGDGNPYTDLTYAPVLSSNSAQQDFSPSTNMTIKAVRFIACLARGQVPASRMTISLRLRSTGALVAQTDLDITELVRPRTSGQPVTATFGVPVNISTVSQYYIHFTCPDEGWLVAFVGVGEGRADLELCSFNGPFDRGHWAGFAGSNDMPAALYASPTPVGGFAAVEVRTPVEAAAMMQGVAITWSPATSLGLLFGHYEIQRWDDDEGFVTIARPTNIDTVAINDWESRIGVLLVYRIRAVNHFGVPSDWSAIQTLTLPPLECRYYFTSNEDPTVNFSGIDTSDGKRLWETTLESEYVPLYGREGGVRFAELERRGDAFTVDLLLYNTTGSPLRPLPGIGGRAAFNPLMALARARISYVCVRNNQGDRWYSSIGKVTPREEQGALYYAEVEVQQMTWIPSPVDV